MKPALLAIDVQNEYFATHGRWVLPEGEPALARIQALLAAARAGGHPVVICGCMTHMCCDTTTRQAKERGFAIWFASDATATRDTLAVMGHFATVALAEEIASRVLRR